jgi:hypothetical protein
MYRSRHAIPPLPHQDPQNRDWKHPRIRFALVPRFRLDIVGPFEREIRTITELAARASGISERDRHVIVVPIYDLQIANLREKFPDVEILGEQVSVRSLGQASIRYVSASTPPLDSQKKLRPSVELSYFQRRLQELP